MTRVLIAEDEQRIASFIEKGLRSQGYSTLIVDNGFDADADHVEHGPGVGAAW